MIRWDFASRSFLIAVLWVGTGAPALGSPPEVETTCAPVAGGELCYRSAGSGCPVVFVGGGSAMDARQWERQIDLLSDSFRTIAVDPRGLGESSLPTGPYSDLDDLAALLTALEIDRAVLVGLSSSGGLVLEFGVAHPGRVAGIVASAPFLPTFPFTEAMAERVAKIGQAAGKGGEEFARVVLADPHFIPAPDHPEVRERARDLIVERFAAPSFDPTWSQSLDPPVASRLSELRAPTLILVGALDHPDLHLRTEFLDLNIADSRRVVIPRGGHTLSLERPDALAAEVRSFVAGLDCAAN